MTMSPVLFLLGVATGVVLFRFFYRSPHPRALVAASLVVVALIYVAFALWKGADRRMLSVELCGLALFSALAWVGFRGNVVWLAIGWAGHAIWDSPVHTQLLQSNVAPGWYEPFCMGADLAVGALLFWGRGWLGARQDDRAPVILEAPLLTQVLDEHAEALGNDLVPYRNHCLRVLNLTHLHYPSMTTRDRELLEVALAFHDLGLWTDGTMDYLEPSRSRAKAWIAHHYPAWSTDEILIVDRIIDRHHGLRAIHPYGPVVDAARRGDWTDVTLGLLTFGLNPKRIAKIRRALPNAGFHLILRDRFRQHRRSRPLSIAPMMRW